jgi:hypothetical protein
MKSYIEWKGHPLNNSDIGYEWDYEHVKIKTSGTTGPFNPVVTEVDKTEKINEKE